MSPRMVLTAFLVTPVLMTATICFAIPKKSRSFNATGVAVAAPAPTNALVPTSTQPPAPPTASAVAKGVRPETLKQGYIIRVKDLTGLASPSSPIYLAHSHNGWDPGSDKFKLQARSDMSWEIIMDTSATDSAMEFKFTRGSWESEELKPDLTVPANRMLPEVEAKYVGSDEKPIFTFEIPKWGDQRPNMQARADANPYYFLSTTGTVRRLEVAGGPASPFKRDVLVWVPPGYDDPANRARRYPVLYMHDGQNLFQKHPAVPAEWSADETATSLINKGEIEPIIIVGIPHSGKFRTVEYLPPVTDKPVIDGQTPGGNAYVDWIVSGVMPRVERAFRVKTGPDSTAIGGSSLGGLISLYAGSTRPDVFGKVLAESPSLGFNGDEFWKRLFSQTQRWPAKVYLAVGGNEAGKPEQSVQYAGMVKAFDQTLSQQGLGNDRRLFIYDEKAVHNEQAWAERFPAAMRFLFPPR